ncbi:MAG TPA: flagellar hook-basal body complex protein [Gaiellaceae bacterium]|jgi:flagellar hook protein FlgE
MFSAISGLQVHQTMLDVAANDIANVNTVGFKGETTTFKDALSQLQRGASSPSGTQGGTNAIQVGLGVQLGAIENQMSAGAPQQTGNPLDLAISGDGFFRVGPASVIGTGNGYSYTRAGNFGLDSAGNLVTQAGDFVIGYKIPHASPPTSADETKITVPTGGKDVSIGTDGTVSYVDSTGTVQNLAQISLAKFPNDGGLERISGNLFAQSNNSGTPVTAVPGDATSGMGSLQSGQVEMSNVDLASEFTTLITAQRGYEANSRVISTADQVLQNLVNIGR